MRSKLRIVDVAEIQGRPDVLAIVEFLEGDLNPDCDEFVREGTGDTWRITSIATHPPTMASRGGKRLPLGLQNTGNGKLLPGDVLFCCGRNSPSK